MIFCIFGNDTDDTVYGHFNERKAGADGYEKKFYCNKARCIGNDAAYNGHDCQRGHHGFFITKPCNIRGQEEGNDGNTEIFAGINPGSG